MRSPALAHRFAYHAPDETKGAQHAQVRSIIGDVADVLDDLLPEGREKALAFTKLEEAMFWANAAIARDTAIEVT